MKTSNGVHCLHRPGQADDRVGFREDCHDRPRVRRLYLISSQFVASASSSPQKTCNRFAAVPHNSESGSLFGRTDVVHIGTPRQQVSRDARSWQIENEAENDSLVNALHQNLEFSFVGNATDPIGPTTVDSLYQRANRFSPPLSAGFVTQPESFLLKPTVAESDTDSFENPNIFGESGFMKIMWAWMQTVQPSRRCVSLPRFDWGSRIRISSICGTHSGSEPM